LFRKAASSPGRSGLHAVERASRPDGNNGPQKEGSAGTDGTVAAGDEQVRARIRHHASRISVHANVEAATAAMPGMVAVAANRKTRICYLQAWGNVLEGRSNNSQYLASSDPDPACEIRFRTAILKFSYKKFLCVLHTSYCF
jgi:hypothetical protein